MSILYRNLVLIFILIGVTSCGYTLRGNFALNESIEEISVYSEGYSPLSNSINILLTNNNIKTSGEKNPSHYRIQIFSENFNRRQLSINLSGRVNEYEVIYSVEFNISAPSEIGKVENITLYRDYSFDENQVMGNTDREGAIKKEMVSTVATLILNKLIAQTSSM
jgi:LPS-assembly lipoprotein